MGSRNVSGLNAQGGFSAFRVRLVFRLVKSVPGVTPKPRFGPILDSTVRLNQTHAVSHTICGFRRRHRRIYRSGSIDCTREGILPLGSLPIWGNSESRRRARDSRAPPVEGGADGCDARALSAQPTAMKSLQIYELPLR